MSILKIGLFLAAVFASSSSVNGENVNGLVRKNPELTGFSAFLDALGISPGLGETVFAPTNAAFSDFGVAHPRLWELYQKPEWFLHLREILLWHLVTEGAFTDAQIFDGGRAQMEVSHGNITIDQRTSSFDGLHRSAISEPNLTVSDGIVHVVSEVIIPPYMRLSIIDQMLKDQSLKFAFSTMANLALYALLDEEIEKIFEDGLTMLVPLNIRFLRAEVNVIQLLTPESFEYTRDFVLCHVIGDNLYESTVFAIHQENEIEQMLVKSWLGTDMWVTTTDNRLRFQSIDVKLPDQLASNGLFHGMDFPLFPPYCSDFLFFSPISTDIDTSDYYRFFRQALLSSQDISTIFNTTLSVWAPTREAFTTFNNEDFNRLLEPIWVRHATEFLLNHISPGAKTRQEWVDMAPGTITMLNGATYEMRKSGSDPRIRNGPTEQGRSYFGDLVALDGLVHTIDSVLTPTAVSRSVYDQSNTNPDFSLLVKNIDFVDLTDMVDRDIPLTMLAPDNKAFRRIIFSTLEGGDLIRQHIFRGLLFHDVLANMTEITSVSGVTHAIEAYGPNKETIWVGGAYIYEHDILARNGVLHYIDRVIGYEYPTIPPTSSPAPTITAEPTQDLPPTVAPVPRANGPRAITFPPAIRPEKAGNTLPSSTGAGLGDGRSGASSLSLVVTALIASSLALLGAMA